MSRRNEHLSDARYYQRHECKRCGGTLLVLTCRSADGNCHELAYQPSVVQGCRAREGEFVVGCAARAQRVVIVPGRGVGLHSSSERHGFVPLWRSRLGQQGSGPLAPCRNPRNSDPSCTSRRKTQTSVAVSAETDQASWTPPSTPLRDRTAGDEREPLTVTEERCNAFVKWPHQQRARSSAERRRSRFSQRFARPYEVSLCID